MKEKVYIETSIISFLTSRPSKDILSAAWQKLTKEWWQKRRNLFSIFTSELVIQEATEGNFEAAKKRLNAFRVIL